MWGEGCKKEGGRRRGEKTRVWKMLFNSASPVTSDTAAVSIEGTAARPENERSNHSAAS